MAVQCEQCGVEEYMPYVCKFCKGRFCAAHRLPENHACAGLGEYRERVQSEGRIFASEPGTPLQPEVTASARAGAFLSEFWDKVNGKMTYVFLGIIAAVYALEWLVVLTAPALFDDLFVISSDFLMQPWTLVTNVFAHSINDLGHIIFNGLVLFFFGTTVERLIGTRRFTWLFLVTGIVAGVVQVLMVEFLFGLESAALGASGAINGVAGTLVVLAPRLTVYIMGIIPMPMWAAVALFAIYDLLVNTGAGSGVGGFAHLSGLALGAGYGYYLRKKGLRAYVPPRQPTMRRYF